MKLLIFGSQGFVGKHLLQDLNTPENILIAVDLLDDSAEDIFSFKNTQSKFVSGNINSSSTLEKIGSVSDVDYIYFLAAHPKMTSSADINESLETLNHVFDFLIKESFSGIFCYFSSSAVYGVQEAQQELTETVIPNPNSPYGISKTIGETLTRYKSINNKFRYLIVRPFNLIGSGQSESFFASNMIRQLALIKAGKSKSEIKLGNLSSSRDFVDVRDLVNAIRLLREKSKNNETYNVASGKTWGLEEVLNKGLLLVDTQVKVLQETLDQSPIKHQKSSYTKISNAVGWKPEISLENSLSDMMNYWLKREGKSI